LQRLINCKELIAYFWQATAPLGARRGPCLFQLPPTERRDDHKLQQFLAELPDAALCAFEFRHPSWFDEHVFEMLSAAGAALVGGDQDIAGKDPPFRPTASFGYLRLRKTDYTEAEIDSWATRISNSGPSEWYVYFKHETRGPELARQLITLCQR
jgi:uncharacterized protein YecE (DUF72 family)